MAKILLEQYNIPRLEINSIQFHGQDDIWTYIWGNAQLSSSKVYKSKGHMKVIGCSSLRGGGGELGTLKT